jgi:hypothetical protein
VCVLYIHMRICVLVHEMVKNARYHVDRADVYFFIYHNSLFHPGIIRRLHHQVESFIYIFPVACSRKFNKSLYIFLYTLDK